MKLAILRGQTHKDYLRTTSAREVAEYQALNLIDPLFIGERVDRAAALIASTMFNMMRSTDAEPMSVADCTPDYSAWITAKSEKDISDEYDQWYAAQIGTGLI
jgi:hypothetical protein